VTCTRDDIVFPIYNHSLYPDSKDYLGFIVTKIIGDNSKHFKLIKYKNSLFFSPTLEDLDLEG